MSVKKINTISKTLFIYILILFLLLLTSINIGSFLTPVNKVLGTKTRENIQEKFWQDFLAKNPDYVPGWIEIGDTNKAYQIDPNYITP